MTDQFWKWKLGALHYGLGKQTVPTPTLDRPFDNDQAEYIKALPKLILKYDVRAIYKAKLIVIVSNMKNTGHIGADKILLLKFILLLR